MYPGTAECSVGYEQESEEIGEQDKTDHLQIHCNAKKLFFDRITYHNPLDTANIPEINVETHLHIT